LTADDIGHHQEVGGEIFGGDEGELLLDAGLDGVRQKLPVAAGGPGIGQLPEAGVMISTGGGEDGGGEVPAGVAAPGELGGIVHSLGTVGIAAADGGFIGEVAVGWKALERGQVGEALVAVHGPEQGGELGLLRLDKVDLPGGDGRDGKLPAGSEQSARIAARAEFAEQVIREDHTGQTRQEGGIGTEDEQAPAKGFQQTGDIAGRFVMDPRNQAAEVGVAIGVLHQQDDILLRGTAGRAAGKDLGAADGLESRRLRQPGKVDEAPQAVGVGEGQAGHAKIMGAGQQLFDGSGATHGRIVGVDVEVGEHPASDHRSAVSHEPRSGER